jgi:hypothetical protein
MNGTMKTFEKTDSYQAMVRLIKRVRDAVVAGRQVVTPDDIDAMRNRLRKQVSHS